jgi:hypothetical protein
VAETLRSETKAVRFALVETKSPPLTPFASLTADLATLNARLRQANIAELRIDRTIGGDCSG